MSALKTRFLVKPSDSFNGKIRLPGDKSISHRSIMLGSLADGVVEVSGFLEGEDALATLEAFKKMGVKIEGPENGKLIIHGVGMSGLQAANTALDLGNSGTSMRLLSGLLAGQNFESTLIGDASLSGRPMRRVTDPLATMGAEIESTEYGTAPLVIKGGRALNSINYNLPVASAQVKSCVLLAGMYAQGETTVTEPAPTRDHTERMLKGFAYPITVSGSTVTIQGGGKLKATSIQVPADISSAAFFMVGAAIAKQADVTLLEVGINPTRTGVIDILKLMGAKIDLLNQKEIGGEPIADIHIQSSQLKGIKIPEKLVPLAIDEFPVLFIAAACARGQTILTGAEELRVKESDRIQVMADGLQALGIDARPTPDGMIINPGQIGSGTVDGHGDHRISMAFTMAGLRSSGPIEILDCDNVATSFPNFVELSVNHGLNLMVKT